MKKSNLKFLIFLTGFLLLFTFNVNKTANASPLISEDEFISKDELISEDELISPLCLTCGGTVTKDYTITSSVREYGPWVDALRPLIHGGPEGSRKTYTESETYTSSISGSTGFDAGAIKSLIGYSSSYSKTFSESQTFNLNKNTTYKLYKRPMYIVYTVRHSVYNMQNGGKQTFKEYRYNTAKKAEGMEINIRVQ